MHDACATLYGLGKITEKEYVMLVNSIPERTNGQYGVAEPPWSVRLTEEDIVSHQEYLQSLKKMAESEESTLQNLTAQMQESCRFMRTFGPDKMRGRDAQI